MLLGRCVLRTPNWWDEVFMLLDGFEEVSFSFFVVVVVSCRSAQRLKFIVLRKAVSGLRDHVNGEASINSA